MVRVFIYTP